MAETIEIYFLTGLQAQNLRSRFWQSSVSGEDSLFGLYVASFSPSSHTSLVSLLLRTLILSDQGPTLTASFNLKYFCEGAVCNCSHTGVSAPKPEVSGDTRIQSRTGNLLKKNTKLIACFLFPDSLLHSYQCFLGSHPKSITDAKSLSQKINALGAAVCQRPTGVGV